MLTWFKAVGLSTLAVLAPIKPLLIAALALTAFDTLSGIMAAKKRGEKITSAGLRRSVSKTLVFMIAILAGFVAEKYMLNDLMPVSKLVAGAIATTECLSIFENLNVATGTNIFKILLGKLGSKNDSAPINDKPAAPPPTNP